MGSCETDSGACVELRVGGDWQPSKVCPGWAGIRGNAGGRRAVDSTCRLRPRGPQTLPMKQSPRGPPAESTCQWPGPRPAATHQSHHHVWMSATAADREVIWLTDSSHIDQQIPSRHHLPLHLYTNSDNIEMISSPDVSQSGSLTNISCFGLLSHVRHEAVGNATTQD